VAARVLSLAASPLHHINCLIPLIICLRENVHGSPRAYINPPCLASSKAGNLVAPSFLFRLRVIRLSLQPDRLATSPSLCAVCRLTDSQTLFVPLFHVLVLVLVLVLCSYRLRPCAQVPAFADLVSIFLRVLPLSPPFPRLRLFAQATPPRSIPCALAFPLSDSRPASTRLTRTHGVTLTGFAPFTASERTR
jgi:hypothetical protein